MQKKLPIGIENFEQIRTDNFYYIDKTGLIQELLQNWGLVNLFTRPRRFGKSLNMSMFKYFFEYGCDKTMFQGLDIEQEKNLCEAYMGKFPVISISLKDINSNNFGVTHSLLATEIKREVRRFQFLMDSPNLTEIDKELYYQLARADQTGNEMPEEILVDSLRLLASLLAKHYGQKVIVLIDEYDVPLDKAQQYGYYDQMILVLRNLFSKVLKTNDSLYFAVLMGCLRLSRESIFTGLNNLQIFSITDVQFDEFFGFTDHEVEQLLEYYDLSSHYDVIREWYDGYRFGNVDVYCPWDVVSYCAALRGNPQAQPKDYWSNTSSNDIVKRFIQKARKSTTKREIEQLIAGETITKEIHQTLTYNEIEQSIDNLWSILFTTGYLTRVGEPDGDLFQLKIPNLEIRKIFTKQIYSWFQEKAENDGEKLDEFCHCLQQGDAEGVEKRFAAYLKDTISIRDTNPGKAV